MAEENLKVGSNTMPIFVDKNGKIVPFTGSVGTNTTPIFVNNGNLTASTASVGSDARPLKMVNGQLVAVTSDLATVADIGKLSGVKIKVVESFPSENNMEFDTIYVKSKSLVDGTSAVVTLDFDNARFKINAVSVIGSTSVKSKTVTLAAGDYTLFMSGGGGGAGAYGWS